MKMRNLHSLDPTVFSPTIGGYNGRPCEVDGEKCNFLRWIDDMKLIINFKPLLTADKVFELRKVFEERRVIPGEAEPVVITNTLALVEMRDGTVKKVDPEKIKFIHTKG